MSDDRASTGETPSADWHPDPFGRHQLRYWDGSRWTEHVADDGAQSLDAPVPSTGSQATTAASAAKVQRQVAKAGGASSAGGGTLFSESVLVVNQKAKVFELTNEYTVFDQQGRQVGSVRQVGQGIGRKVLRALTNVDQFLSVSLEICDEAGVPTMKVSRGGAVLKSKFSVTDAHGSEIGKILQQNVIGKIRFGLESPTGEPLGAILAQNWRAWNFSIVDANDREVAKITKTWEGMAKAMFTTADNYVLHITEPLTQPLHSLVLASALTVDTALKQTDKN